MEIDFELKPYKQYCTACPKCSETRRKRGTKSLSVFRDDDGFVRVKCHHTEDCEYGKMTQFKDPEPNLALPAPVEEHDFYLPIPEAVDLPETWKYQGKDVANIYWYRDVLNRPLYAVLRTETKDFPPLALLKTGAWTNLKYPKVQTLFGAEFLNGKSKVLVVEGEKAALAGQKLYEGKDIAVVTWRGGAKNIQNGAWHLLKGKKEVYLWPDNDIGGVQAMRAISELIPANVIKILEVGHLPPKADIADTLSKEDIAIAFRDATVITSTGRGPMTWDQIKSQNEFLNKTVSSGYDLMDAHVKLPPSGVVVIEGRTGHGKSAFAINLADNFLRLGKRVVMFSYEMPASRTFARFIRRSDTNLKVEECVSDTSVPSYLMEALNSGQLEIYDQSAQFKASDLVKQLDTPEYNGALVVVDYLQIVPMTGLRGDKHDLIKEQLMDPLRVVANNHGFIVAALSQLTPNYGSPELDSPRECRDIHMSAEMVLRVWNRESFAEHPVYDFAKGNYTVHVYKNRDGESNMVFDCVMDRGALITPTSIVTPKDVLKMLKAARQNRRGVSSKGEGTDAF